MDKASQEIRQFLHDLRTPLSVIKLMLEVIKNAKSFDSKSLEILEEESLKLQNLIEEFSKKATLRPEGGMRSIHQEPPQGVKG